MRPAVKLGLGVLGALALAGTALGATVAAGVGGSPERTGPAAERQETEGPRYDGRFTFLRLRFDVDGGRGMRSFGYGGRGREPAWAHDMPRAERNFSRILAETTTLDPYLGGGKVLDLDDPELFRYPIAYIVEVGRWVPDEPEVEALRAYLLKGGFLIVDDFRGWDLNHFLEQMGRVVPGAQVRVLEPGHRIFDTFFYIEDPEAFTPPYSRQPPQYLGIWESAEPDAPLLAVLNYNNDIAEYWEYSDRGFYPIALSNDAYKFGVNYVIYGMTF